MAATQDAAIGRAIVKTATQDATTGWPGGYRDDGAAFTTSESPLALVKPPWIIRPESIAAASNSVT